MSVSAQHVAAPAADATQGERLYAANCARCHGFGGDAVPGVDFRRGQFRRAVSDEDLARIIANGIPGTLMPANPFAAEEASQVIAFLRSMSSRGAAETQSVPGDPGRGKRIFETKGGCGACHTVVRGARSAGRGPELFDIGASKRSAELQAALVEPDADINIDYRTVRVTMKSGATIAGRLLNHDSFSIQMLEFGAGLRSIQKSDTRSYDILKTSSMPSYKASLEQDELSDVVAYLMTLKSKPGLPSSVTTERVVAQTGQKISRKLAASGQCAVGSLVADAQRAALKTDVALVNPAELRTGLDLGPVTWGELFAVQPAGRTLVVVTMLGASLLEVLNEQWSNRWWPDTPKQQERGPSLLAVAGLSYAWDGTRPIGDRILDVRVGGEPLDPLKRYTIAVNSALASGEDGFSTLSRGERRETEIVDLDALISYVTSLPQPFTAPVDERVRRLAP